MDISASLLAVHNPNLIEEASHFGQTKTVNWTFNNRQSLNLVFLSRTRLEYDFFQVAKYKQAPQRCFRCQSFDHLIESCRSDPRCAICSRPHTSSKDSPCNAGSKCILCNEPHVCFWLKCQKVKEILRNKSYS